MNTTNCEDPETGLEQTTAFSLLFGLSYSQLNETIPHKWLDAAIEITKEFQMESIYWDVGEHISLNPDLLCFFIQYLE